MRAYVLLWNGAIADACCRHSMVDRAGDGGWCAMDTCRVAPWTVGAFLPGLGWAQMGLHIINNLDLEAPKANGGRELETLSRIEHLRVASPSIGRPRGDAMPGFRLQPRELSSRSRAHGAGGARVWPCCLHAGSLLSRPEPHGPLASSWCTMMCEQVNDFEHLGDAKTIGQSYPKLSEVLEVRRA